MEWEERARRRYDESIAYLDHEMGRLFDQLDQRGLLDNTIVVVTSDHGEEFVEHGIIGHGKSLYWSVTQVPLAFWFGSRLPAGLRVSEPVSLRGVPRTLAEMAGLPDAPLPGRSLARAWDGSGTVGDTALSELTSAQDAPKNAPIGKGDMKALVLDSLHYILNGDGSEEVYDVVRDPMERHNLVDSLDPAVLTRFRTVMAAIPRQSRTVRQTF
jgi:arylsulfatase A-like enzyme